MVVGVSSSDANNVANPCAIAAIIVLVDKRVRVRVLGFVFVRVINRSGGEPDSVVVLIVIVIVQRWVSNKRRRVAIARHRRVGRAPRVLPPAPAVRTYELGLKGGGRVRVTRLGLQG